MMEEWRKYKLAWEIYGALKLAGADIGDASVPIISDVLEGYIWPDTQGVLAKPCTMLIEALEMVQRRLEEKPGGVLAFSGEEWTQIDKAIAAAKEAAG